MLEKEEILNKFKHFNSLGINIITIQESKNYFELHSLKNNKYLREEYEDNLFDSLVNIYNRFTKAKELNDTYDYREFNRKFKRISLDNQNLELIKIYIFLDTTTETLNDYVNTCSEYLKIVNDEFDENPLFEELHSIFKKDYTLLFKKPEQPEKKQFDEVESIPVRFYGTSYQNEMKKVQSYNWQNLNFNDVAIPTTTTNETEVNNAGFFEQMQEAHKSKVKKPSITGRIFNKTTGSYEPYEGIQ